MESEHPLTFADQVRSIPGGEHLEMCYSCGTCVSKCMIQQKLEPEYNPRRLLRLVTMDMREEAFNKPHHLAVFGLRPVLSGLPAADPYFGRDRRGQAAGS